MKLQLFKKLEAIRVTPVQWVGGFFGILFIRFFLENLSSSTFSGVMATDVYTILHYTLFYLAVLLSLWLILDVLLPQKRSALPIITLFGLMVIWLAPIIDLMLSAGAGYDMAYIMQTPGRLVLSWLTYFGPLIIPGATPGIRIEVALLLAGLFTYVKQTSGSFSKGLIALVASYTAIFFWGSLPSFMYAIALLFGGQVTVVAINEVAGFFYEAIQTSLISIHVLHPTVLLASADRAFEVFFNISLSQAYYLLIPILVASWLARAYPKWLKGIVRNIRPERLGHYLGMTAIGCGLAILSGTTAAWHWLDVMTVIVLFVAVASAWLFAVAQNDISDQAIDAVSNRERPLITGAMTVAQMRMTAGFFFTWAIVGGALVSHYALFFIAVYIALAHVYSMPPLRLRRWPGISSLIVGVASATVAMAGYYTLHFNQTTDAFSLKWLLLLVVIVALGANVKDVKDVAGDKKAGVLTIPVLLGDVRARWVIGGLLSTALLLVPLLLEAPILWTPSIVAALIAPGLIAQKRFKDWWFFLFYYLYAFIVVWMLLVVG